MASGAGDVARALRVLQCERGCDGGWILLSSPCRPLDPPALAGDRPLKKGDYVSVLPNKKSRMERDVDGGLVLRFSADACSNLGHFCKNPVSKFRPHSLKVTCNGLLEAGTYPRYAGAHGGAGGGGS